MQSRLLKAISLFTLISLGLLPFCANAQVCRDAQLEMFAGAGNPTVNGPSISDQVITFQNNTNNPVGNTLAAYTPALTASYSFSNQQYTGVTGLTGTYQNGMLYGAALNSVASALFPTLNVLANANNTNFSSTPALIGSGIDVTANRGVGIALYARALQNNASPLVGDYYYGDITVTFNQAVDYPIINVSDFGGFFTSGTTHLMSAALVLQNGLTATKLSGDAAVAVSGGDTLSSVPTGTTAATNFFDASFKINGTGITTVTFKVFLRGLNNAGAWSATAAGNSAADVFTMSFTLPDFVPSKPIALSDTLKNSCPGNTYNLFTVMPASIAGQTYEFHTVSVNPSVATQVSVTANYAGSGPLYLFAKDSATACYSQVGDTINLLNENCPPTFGCTGNSYLFQNLPTDLIKVNLSTGVTSQVASNLAGTNTTSGVNGIGYNVTDGYMWGQFGTTNQVVRVGADGTTTYYTIAGLPAAGFPIGDVSSTGVLYLYGSNVTTLYRVDVNPTSPTYLTLMTPNLATTSMDIRDWSFNPLDGNLYGLSNARVLYRINPATGSTTNLGTVSGGTPAIANEASGFGAGWFDNLGNFYVSGNTNGRIFQILNSNTAVAGATYSTPAVFISTGPASTNNDGARCNTAPLCVVPANPITSASSTYNICPSTTVDLTSLEPAALAGVTYEWHTVAVNPLVSTLVANPSSITSSGTFYLFAKSNAGSCYSAAADTVNVAIYNPCTDCDADGIPNEVDIDDDNDGVADNSEQGCGTTGAWTSTSAGVWVSNISPNLKVRVTFANASGTGAWSVAGQAIANFARNCTDYTSDYAPIVNVNKPALLFTKASGTSVGSFTVEYLDASNNPVSIPNARMHLGGLGGSFGAGQIGSSSWKLQGGKTMTTLSRDLIDFGTTIDSIYHPRLFQAGSGVNDCATGEGSATVAINGTNSSYTFNVKMNGATIDQMIVMFEACDFVDTDNDGIINACDLDSDGDGCADAVEAGNVPTTPTSAWSSTNVYPTTRPANTSSSSYAAYAVVSTDNYCTLADCDGDGIPNVTDTDDDNDGVSDVQETTNCKRLVDFTSVVGGPIASPTGVANSTAIGTLPNNTAVTITETSSNLLFETGYSTNQSLCYFNAASYSPANQANADAFKLISYNTATSGQDSFVVSFSPPVSEIYMYVKELDYSKLQFPSNVTISKLSGNTELVVNNTTKEVSDLNPNNSTNLTCNVDANSAEGIIRIQGTNISNLAIRSIKNNTLNNGDAVVLSFGLPQCWLDSDKDGIADACDLDSDNDGCADAVEAGNVPTTPTSAWSSTSVYPSSAPSNTSSTSYATYALDSLANFCVLADCDADGIPNIIDIDDDNDGVSDVIENTCDVPAVANSVSGTGLNQDKYYFFNWTDPSLSNGIQNGDSQTFTLPNGEVITATFSNCSAACSGITMTDMNSNYAGSPFYTRYNTSGTKESFFTGVVTQGTVHSFTINWTATKNGQPWPLYIVLADAESQRANEPANYTTNGSPWEVLETYGTPQYSGVGTQTFNNIRTDALGVTLNASYGATRTDIYMSQAVGNQGGASGVVLGIKILCDKDNDVVLNSCDLDSDGDGCSDAVESLNVPAAPPSAWTSSGTYASTSPTTTSSTTYNSYALDSSLNMCALPDCDLDGLPNIFDIDDDNDGIKDSVENFACSSSNSNSLTATGTGINKPYLYWFNWTAPAFTDGLQNGDSQTFTLNDGTLVTATFSNVSGPGIASMVGTDMQTFAGAKAYTVYNTTGLKEALSTFVARTDNSFNCTVNFTATKAGSPVPLNLVYVDAEATNSSESQTIITNGGFWKQLELSGTVTSNGLGSTTYNLANSLNGAQFIYSENASTLTIDINSVAAPATGNEAMAFGLLLYCDADNDGIVNACDTDSDGDGCPDALEAGTTTNNLQATIAGPYGANGLANSIESNDSANAQVINVPYYSYSNYQNAALSTATNLCASDCDNDGIPNYFDIDDDNDGVSDLTECPSLLYKVYTFNRPGPGWSTNAPFTITGQTSQSVIIDQNVLGSDLSYNGVNWKLLASNVQPDITSKITIALLPTATTNGSFLAADAALITNGVDTIVIDNSSGSGFSTTGTWVTQTVASAYLGGQLYSNTPHTGKTATWSFTNITPALCDNDNDASPNTCDLDSDNDGCSDAFEAGATTNTAANYAFPTPVNAQGVSTSVPTYTSTYSLNALNPAIKPCCGSLNAGSDKTICAGNQVSMNAVAGPGVAKWVALASNPSVVSFVDTLNASTLVSGFTNAGTYKLVWTNGSCSDTVDVVVNTKPNAGANQYSICSGATATLTGTNTTAGLWTAMSSNPAGASLGATAAGVASVTLSSSASGVYQFIYTVNSCSDTVLLQVNNTPNTPIASATQPTCTAANGSITVTAPSASGMTYSIDGATYTNTNGVFSNVAPGTYNVTAKSDSGCVSSATPITINPQPPTPAAATFNITQPTCTLATATITVTAPLGAGLSYSIDGVNYSNTTGIFNNVPSGSYTVTVKNSNGCTSPNQLAIVNAQPLTPAPPSISPSAATICSGNSTTLNGSGCSGNLTWFVSTDTLNSIGSGASLSVSPTANTSYVAKCTNLTSGCTSNISAPSVITVVVPPLGPSISVSKDSICAGQSITLSGLSCNLPDVLNWTKDGSAFGSGLLLNDIPAVGTHTYTAVCNTTGAVSCASSGSNLIVVVSPLPATPSITPAPTTTICSGTSTTLSATGALAGQTYLWSDGQTGSTITVSPSVSTNYTVKIINNATLCEGASSAVTTVNVVPTPSSAPLATIAPSTICAGDSASLSANCSLGNAVWYSNAAMTNVVTGNKISPAATSTYYVRCENLGCFGPSLPLTLTVNAKPSKPSLNVVQAVCPSVEGSITITAPSGANITYSIDNTTYTNISGVFNNVLSGVYTVSAKSDLGCLSDTTIAQLNSISCPDTIHIQPACPTCPSGPVCPTANSLPSGPGAISYSSCGTPSGYTVSGPDANGCMTFTPNGTNTINDTTCIVACKNGVCDTSFIIIHPPVTPDTINVTPACPTCPVTVCVTANDLPSGAGATSYSTCGSPSDYTMTGPDVNGCYTLTGNGAQDNVADTTCIVACKNGICDTTYVIVNPPVTPDTTTITPACPTCPVTVCATADDLPSGAGVTSYSTCGGPTGYTMSGPDVNGCYTLTGNGAQDNVADTTCIVACKNGICDTTYVIVNPPVRPDTINVTPACATCPVTACATADDLPSGAGATTYTSCGTPSGYTAVGPDVNGCLTFTPSGSNTSNDTTCVVACKNGICDTTFIIIHPPVTPDTINVTPACPTCPVTICATANDLPSGAGATSYSTCGSPAGYTTTGPDVNGCYTLTGNGTQDNVADTTCIVACKNGICDTTYVIVNPPVTPDTITVTPACPTCPVTVCATADDLPSGAGATSYATCGSPTGYIMSGPDVNGCYTITGNGTQDNVADTTCIVACKNGICDTTYVIVNPPIQPDTTTVTPACPTCPVTVCATADDLPSGAGAISYSTCGSPTSYTMSGPDVNGCYTVTGNGTQDNVADTTCIVACKNGICDTTYVIVNPPIRPSYDTAQPTCPTCPAVVCAIVDDIPQNASTTYSSCGLDPAEATFGSVVYDLNGCLIWTGNSSFTNDTITTCMVACNGTVCDTTYITILPPTPPYGPDTVTIVPTCGTCPTSPLCPTADDVPSGYTNVSISNCGLDANEALQGTLSTNASGCIIWTPNGTQTDTIRTCVIKCADTTIGATTITVCDTTIVYIAPAPKPDTISVTPACPTCPVNICTTADDIYITSGTTFSSCGAPADYSFSAGPNAAGCYTLVGNGVQDNVADTTCLVACNGAICDTTYVIVNPPIKPDTITITPPCSTCTISACATKDDLNPTAGITYTTCGAPSGYSAGLINPTTGCVTYTPTSNPPATPVVTCIVAIDSSGKADTTFVIIEPTVQTNPDINITFVNVPVNGDVSTNDDVPAGTTYGNNVTADTGNPGSSLPVINPDGSYSFSSPVPGVFNFTVPVITPSGDTIPTLLTITVLDNNSNSNLPVANTDIATTPYNTPVSINTLANDQPGNPSVPLVPSSVTVITGPSNGSSSINPTTGEITYTPNPGFVGKDTIYYTVADSNGNVDTAIQIITVLPPGAANTTSATDDYSSGGFGQVQTGNAILNDVDAEGHPTTIVPQNNISVPQGVFSIDANGNYTFTPSPGFSGPVDFPYTLTDSLGATANATIHILVYPQEPTPNPDINATWADIPVTGDVSTNDNGYPAGTTYGSATPVGSNPSASTPVVAPDGTYTFTSPVPGVYTFTVPVQPCPTCAIDSVILTITVLDSTSNENAPIANTDLSSTLPATPVTIPTLLNDGSVNSGSNGGLNPASVNVISNPSNGTVTVDTLTGNITYTPNPGFTGKDTLYYEVCDSQVVPKCATAMQIITVVDTSIDGNTTLASDDFNTTTDGNPVSGIAILNDVDAEGDAQTITPQNTTIPGVGTLVLDAAGNYTFTPVPGYVGPANFPYTVTDSRGAVADATIYFVVTAPSIILSLDLLSFNVLREAQHNSVQWITTNELDLNRFELYRSFEDATHFELIHVQVPTQKGGDTYLYNDGQIKNGFTYYQLRSIDNSTDESRSQIISVYRSGVNLVNVYPNPAKAQLNIAFNGTQHGQTLYVYDGKGSRVFETQIKSNAKFVSINISHLAAGSYTIQMLANGQKVSIPFVKKD